MFINLHLGTKKVDPLSSQKVKLLDPLGGGGVQKGNSQLP